MASETPSDLLSSYETICARDYAHSRVYFLGEHHDSPASGQLVSRLLNAVEPTLIAVESTPSQQFCGETPTPISTGIDEGIQYAQTKGIPVGLIDKSQMDLLSDFSLHPPEPIPVDPPQPNSDGDIPADAVADYRDQIKTQCPQRHEVLLTQREQCMARYLATLADISDGPLVTVLGASHLRAVADRLTEETLQPLDVPDSRLYRPD